MTALIEHQEIRVTGTVQGVGFRPTVYRLALECQLNGEVSNDSGGVLIRLSGIQRNIRQFLQRLQNEAPPLAKIDSIQAATVRAGWRYHDFRIGQSSRTQGHTEVPADAATCHACLAEMLDPGDRRHGYPFVNCTHCGPRLSIIQGRPYDRPQTTMARFQLCEPCRREYADPLDRRFHAQPIACPQCGPQVTVHEPGVPGSPGTAPWHRIDSALRAGRILALKGLGGFHLCCDATNDAAVQLLRKRKHRDAKPLALMAPHLACVHTYCLVSDIEQEALLGVAAPIVLLTAREVRAEGVPKLSDAVAPGSRLLGFMLPYTPLHHLICRRFGRPLVMTSGNLSGEPQIIDNQQAIDKLGAIADLVVCHDRDIENRIDDSVVRCVSGRSRVLRRARGHAPRSLRLPEGLQEADRIVAYGAELKSTFCLVKNGMAILSQHQGDLEDVKTSEDYEHNLALYLALFDLTPHHLACDPHPEYISSKLARRESECRRLPLTEVQHHHAHIASVLAENGVPLHAPQVLGIAFDGLGFGDDAALWGGEFLLADYHRAVRLARLKPVAMPGGTRAITQPWRNTVAHIRNSVGWDRFVATYGGTALADFLAQRPVKALHAMLDVGLNCPLASSAGRLFDAVAGALQLHGDQVAYEGQAAIELEMLADANAVLQHGVDQPYPMAIDAPAGLMGLDAAPMWPALLHDLLQGTCKSTIATRFHAGLIDGTLRMVDMLARKFEFSEIALSGGCMQNAILLAGLEQGVRQRGYRCFTHASVPANDGGIALGQAVVAAARTISPRAVTA